MHILYVDDSGSVSNPGERFLVLGGVSVFERGIYHLITNVERCVEAFDKGDPDSIELHATDMYGGRGQPWSTIKAKSQREELLGRVGRVLLDSGPSVTLFSVAVDKISVSPRDPVEVAFEEICNRFNLFIQRTNNRNGQNNRGLVVMDESRHREPLQALARQFRISGARWGHFRCLAEVPLFADSRATRIIQLADFVAWSTFRNYEYEDGRFLTPVLDKFDQDGGILHGIYHVRGSSSDRCYCPACMSRERPRISR